CFRLRRHTRAAPWHSDNVYVRSISTTGANSPRQTRRCHASSRRSQTPHFCAHRRRRKESQALHPSADSRRYYLLWVTLGAPGSPAILESADLLLFFRIDGQDRFTSTQELFYLPVDVAVLLISFCWRFAFDGLRIHLQ